MSSFFFFSALETQSRRPEKQQKARSFASFSCFSLFSFFQPPMAVEVLVALAAVLAAALAVRWARHHGPLRPRGAPPIFEGAPLVGGLLKFAKVSSFEAHWSHRWRDIAPLSWLAPEADRIVARRRRGGFILSRSATIFSPATSLAVATHLFLSVCPYILLPFWPFWSLMECQQKQGARTDPLAWLDWESNAERAADAR